MPKLRVAFAAAPPSASAAQSGHSNFLSQLTASGQTQSSIPASVGE
jgi:hypothetical protein